jgi:hypothetical protein
MAWQWFVVIAGLLFVVAPLVYLAGREVRKNS